MHAYICVNYEQILIYKDSQIDTYTAVLSSNNKTFMCLFDSMRSLFWLHSWVKLIVTSVACVRTFQLKPRACRISSFIYRCTVIARTLLPSDAHPRKRVDVSENAWPPEFAKSIKLRLHSFHFTTRHSKADVSV